MTENTSDLSGPDTGGLIRIDGSYGEGGGQILRTALALSCITGKPFEIYNIRQGRKKPGLQPQHLTGVTAAGIISRADIKGAELGSQRLTFSPGEINGGEYSFDVSEVKDSAGSVTLILQAVLPALATAKKAARVSVKGGTHVAWSPPFHYMKEVLLPCLHRIGISAGLEIEKWGWYPIGGGKARLTVEPFVKLVSVDIVKRGRLRGLSGISAVSNLPIDIAERQRDHGNWLLKSMGLSAKIETVVAPSIGKGTFFFILAEFDNIRVGFSALGERGNKAEAVAEEAFREFAEFSNSEGAADPHLADQIIPYLALCGSPCTFTTSRVTRHLLTNVWVIKKFLPVEITVNGKEGQFGEIEIKKAGD